MKFTVNFIGDYLGMSVNPINVKAHYIGLKEVRRLRDDIGLDLDVKRIKDYIDGLNEKVKIEISESIASDSKLFEDSCCLDVRVPNTFLNKYAFNSIVLDKDNKTGEIISAKFVKKIDFDEVIKDWAGAGFPTEWGFEKPKEEPEKSVDDEFLTMAHKGNISTETMQQVVNVLEARMFDGGEEA